MFSVTLKNKVPKKKLAASVGVSRATLYYRPKQPAIDEEIIKRIKLVQVGNPAYGHKRIAPELGLNKKRIRRIMKLFNMKPLRVQSKKPRKKEDENKKESGYPNLIKHLCPIQPNVVWVSDFTYIWFQGRFYYVATIMDLYTREIIGWNISANHDTALVLGCLIDALERTGATPVYLHSDQGSEYESAAYTGFAEKLRILISMSAKASPWENGFQESFYSQFKVDLGEVKRFETLGELIEAIGKTMHYYNTKRYHTSLKMNPVAFKNRYLERMGIIGKRVNPL